MTYKLVITGDRSLFCPYCGNYLADVAEDRAQPYYCSRCGKSSVALTRRAAAQKEGEQR